MADFATHSKSYLNRTPTTPELYRHLVQRVAYKWEGLCILLELDQDGTKLEIIRRDFFHLGSEMCLMQAFLLWLKRGGRQPVNWNTIITCLEDMEFYAVVKDLQKILQPSASSEDFTVSHTAPAPALLPSTLSDSPLPYTTAKYQLKLIVESELRDYQWELALPGLSGQNYIICAPTGSGKTRVAGLIISEHLQRLQGRGKVLFVVNKVPLVQQQRRALQDMIEGIKIDEVAGDMSNCKKAMLSASLKANSSSEDESEKRFDLENDIIVCTAGCLLNELDSREVTLAAISLMVIDECHHTRKNSIYAQIMDSYVRSKISNSTKLPQVVGLTATPGAGDSSRPSVMSVIDHMVTLCAAMDATGGIHTVTRHVSELKTCQTSAIHTKAVLEGRSEDEPFIRLTTTIMTKLEPLCKSRPPSDNKWSPKYSGWVNTMLHDQNDRDKMSILKTLKNLSSVLQIYHNLTFDDALAELSQLVLPSGENATPTEQNLMKAILQLKIKLTSLDRVENPLLLQLEHILEENFKNVPNSKAIIFVETKNEATSIHRWITSRAKLHAVHPDVITGQTRDTGIKMTKAEQNASLEGFREDSCNLLVSTSVLEEGVDVPACNLVIRYQKVTSEIAQIQSRGRARASHSQSITIVNSNSGKQFQEMLNEEKNYLVEQALEMFPTGEYLHNAIKIKQAAILKQRDVQIKVVERGYKYSPMEVDICCSHCSALLCNGSDIHTIPTTLHYVITNDSILSRITIREHHRPSIISRGLSRTKKLFCATCESQALGVIGKWWKNNVSYPVIKCNYVKFVVRDEMPITRKQWKNAPFEVSPMS